MYSRYRLYKGLFLITLLCSAPLFGFAQERAKQRGPRAIAIVRWQTNAQGKAVPHLLPVAILDNGRFYDAGLYRATPRPMALDPGVVYEALDHGAPLGFFTVQRPMQNEARRQWFALGEWKTDTSTFDLEMKNRTQTVEVVRAGEKAGPILRDPVDDRDVGKKTTEYDEEGREIDPAKAKEQPTPKKSGDKQIERLPQVGPSKKEAPKTTSADDDPERPRLKRDTKPAAGTQPAAAGDGAPPANKTPPEQKPVTVAKTPEDADPNRPVLRRGTQQKRPDVAEASAGTPVPLRVQARGDSPSPSVRKTVGFAQRTYEAVAVSDAEDGEYRQDYRFRWSESEREEMTAKLRSLAQQEITKYLQSIGRAPSPPVKATSVNRARGSKVAATPQPELPVLQDLQVAALDLDFNNSAELVFTGREILQTSSSPNPVQVFVTVVARTDIDGNPRKLFSSVTTSDRLDVTPRLDLVDAVDADGDKRAELLFRRVRDNDAEFIIYRVGVDGLTELFHGGNAE